MEINWPAVTAIGAWVVIIGGLMGWSLRSTIKNAFADAMDKLDERYADKEITTERFERVHERLNDNTRRIEQLEGWGK